MTTGDPSPVARCLRRLLTSPPDGGLTDAELLERFATRRDEAAFEVLVWRHGPMVLGVCRRILRHEQDAEDAFQATFLVLLRKAASIGNRQAVGGWLYRVAHRIALRARSLAAKRAARQEPVADVPKDAPTPDVIWRDLRPVLDEEVDRLPEKYRDPFILCYLDGKTNEEAARELGCPKGTVLSRLAWARERLRARLTRRGLTLSAGGLAAALAPATVTAALPSALVGSTVRAVRLVAAGPLSAGAVPERITALTQGALRAMMWTKVKIALACVLTIAALGLGAAGLAGRTPADERTSAPQQKPRDPGKAEPPATPEKKFEVQLRDQDWADVLEWYAKTSGLTYVASHKPAGKVTIVAPKADQRYTLTEITDLLNEALTSQHAILVRREASFTVLPADEKVDPSLVPRVGPDDLEKRGRTELVSLTVTLTSLKAVELAPEVKRMMGKFGDVVVLQAGNRLTLQDTAGNLRFIYKTIREMEAEAGKKRE